MCVLGPRHRVVGITLIIAYLYAAACHVWCRIRGTHLQSRHGDIRPLMTGRVMLHTLMQPSFSTITTRQGAARIWILSWDVISSPEVIPAIRNPHKPSVCLMETLTDTVSTKTSASPGLVAVPSPQKRTLLSDFLTCV